MDRMNRRERMIAAKQQLNELLEDWAKEWEDPEAEGPAALDIVTESVTTITVQLGGPTVYLEYNHATGLTRFFTTAPDYEHRTDPYPEMLELYAEDAQDIEEMFQLDMLAQDHGFPVGQP